MSSRSAVLSLALLACCPPGGRADEPAGWFPFVLPWDDDAATAVSAAGLSAAPAGADGFVQARGGHLLDGKGRRLRFLGVNLVFSASFPHKADASRVAARLRKFGVNVVRLHHMDYFHAPAGIFDARHKDTQHLDPDQLDRLDHLIWQLKRQGIYTNVNLHVSRAFNAADGLPQADRLPERGKVAAYFYPRLTELQQGYAKALLGRVNRYTKTRLAEEPAVAFVELTNENTLLGAAWTGQLDALPAPYREELQRQWNAWLGKRHAGTAALAGAWKVRPADRGPELLRPPGKDGLAAWHLERHAGAKASAERLAEGGPKGVAGPVLRVRVEQRTKEGWHVQLSQPDLDLTDGRTYTLTFHARADRKRPISVAATIAVADWRNVGLARRVALTPAWQAFRLTFTASRTRKGRNRVAFALGDAAGTVELAGLSLRRGEEGALPEGASLEKGTVPLGHPSAGPAGLDWIRFLMDTERRYLETMRTFLKKELGVRALVSGSQASYGGLGGALRELGSDYADMHAYWQHPHFPRRAWDPVDWTVGTMPLTRDRWGGSLASLARYRLAGRAFTVSEYNHPAPADHQAECVPLLAAFAAFQDWDGVYLFDYSSDRDQWDTDRVRGFFSIDSNPAKMAFLPAAAWLFRRGDFAPAREETVLEVPRGEVPALMARHGPGVNALWERAGGMWPEALRRRVSVRFVDTGEVRTVRRKGDGGGTPGVLGWQDAGTERARFTADAPAAKVIAGALGTKVAVGGWTVERAGKGPASAVLMLSARDGLPAERSRSLLLTAVARVENAGMGWNAERTSVGRNWGKGPVRCEAVEATVTLVTGAKRATVHALDPVGKRRAVVKSRLRDGVLTFTIGAEHRTVWYEIEAE
jgi:hypothetical protein